MKIVTRFVRRTLMGEHRGHYDHDTQQLHGLFAEPAAWHFAPVWRLFLLWKRRAPSTLTITQEFTDDRSDRD